MRAFDIIAVLLAGLSTTAFAQLVQPGCNEGGGKFTCSDANNACQRVSTGNIGISLGQTAVQIGGFGTAAVWLKRKVSSATLGNMNELCNQIVTGCCQNPTSETETISYSHIPLMDGESGVVYIARA